ncbi:type IV toxin-antitoxin system AbiEi family antitoxin [Kribbella sp. NPDC051620]|uniref:type IV toxin-antitoxin system AbiEi family antitoxin n=1 Tax=Kribbella sp. NPDC051620 TaxID=3364120 RepID=UPI0037B886F5
MEPQIASLLSEQVDAIGLEIDGPTLPELLASDGAVQGEIRRHNARADYWLAYRRDMTFTEIVQLRRWAADRPLLVLGERITERSANALREADVQYLDSAGNAYIAFEDVLIDIRGRRSSVPLSRSSVPARSTNLFSPRRARVVFALVTWPALVRASVRELAAVARVSSGLTHDCLDLLERNGYLSSGRQRELRDGEELLDHWTAAYPSGLAPTLRLGEFSGDIDEVRPARPDQPIFVSGESAVPRMIRPVSLTLYVDVLDPMLAIRNRWRSDEQPNIVVRQKFWTDPGVPEELPDGKLLVPWTLAYADLMATGESRQREAAHQLRADLAEF